MEIDLDVLGGVTCGEKGAELFKHVGGELDIESATSFVMEVGVRMEVRAVAGRETLEIDGPHELMAHEGFQAIVDGGQGNRRHDVFHSGKNFVGGGVISFIEKDLVNCFALGSGT